MISRYIRAFSITLLLLVCLSASAAQMRCIHCPPRMPITASTIDQLGVGWSDVGITAEIAFHHDSQLMVTIYDPSLSDPEIDFPRSLNILTLMKGESDYAVFWDYSPSLLENHTLNANDSMRRVVASPTSDRIAVGEDNGIISVWDVMQRRIEIVTRTDAAITDLLFHPSNDYLFVVGSYEQIEFIPAKISFEELVENFGYLRELDIPPEIEYISNLSFNSDGTLLAFGADESVGLWDGDTLEQIGIFPTEIETLQKVLFHPQLLDTLFTLAGTNVKRWHWDGQQLMEEMSFDIPQLTGPATTLSADALNLDGSVLLAVYNQSHIVVWNTDTGELIDVPAFDPWKNPEHRVYGAAFSPDSMWLALGTEGLTFYSIP